MIRLPFCVCSVIKEPLSRADFLKFISICSDLADWLARLHMAIPIVRVSTILQSRLKSDGRTLHDMSLYI